MANEGQVERLLAGVEEWNAWREVKRRLKPDLSEANLSHANLIRANLERADLSEAILGKADLERADLEGANLNGADLRAANLRGADLSFANLLGATLSGADLFDADLRGADLKDTDLEDADLNGANLKGANLRNANLRNANLSHATLIRANLIDADLVDADLSDATLNGATLRNADLRVADFRRAVLEAVTLEGANLEGANLSGVDAWSTDFRGAILSGAKLKNTVLGSLDLSGALGLAEVKHESPSTIGTDTLEHTAQGLKNAPPERRGEVETFLRGAGVPELVMDAFQLMVASPIEFYSVFISYSHRDKPFARRLYEALQARGIRCWLDEHALLPGDDIADSIDHGIRVWDKVLLCCSEDSLRSYWVEAELAMAMEKEQQLRKERDRKVLAIIPLDLDGYLFKWKHGRAAMIRERLAADFTGWDTDHAKFEAQLERVCAALQTERESGPEPKL